MARYRITHYLDMFRSAVAASSAAEEGKAPHNRDLERLGIDPAQYRSIRTR